MNISRGRPGAAVSGVMTAALLSGGCILSHGQRYETFITPTPLAPGECLVLGFLGGREDWDSADQGVRKLALSLRARKLPEVHVETVENQKRALALELIQNAFDRDRDGTLGESERRSARLVLYGKSFGGAAVVKLAQELETIDVPVLLTVQVDSVGRGDAVIPANVAAAANLYQAEGMFLRGEPRIRARDPMKTRVLGNFLFDYRSRKIDLSGTPWYKRIFREDHAKMNVDPEVWARVESLILEAISPARP